MTQVMDAPAGALATTNGNGNGNGNGAVATRKYDPFAPVGNAGSLKSLLDAQRNSIAQALPRHITPERLIKTLLVAANRTPDLLQCTQASVLETINRAAELGLDLSGTLGEAYAVPFNNKIKIPGGGETWVKQCQLIIGYRGLAKLARQSGEISRIEADVVCENDDFVMRKGSSAKCEFAPAWKTDRGEIVGAFAYVLFKDGGEQFDFMPFADIEKVRARSKSGTGKDGNAIGAWKSDWPEMAKKTVFRRVAKWLPLSTEKFTKAMEVDNEDHGLLNVLEASTGERQRGMAGLLPKVTGRPLSEGQSLDLDPERNAPPADDDAERILRDASPSAPKDDPDPPGPEVPPEQEADAGAEARRIAIVEAVEDVDVAKSNLYAHAKSKGFAKGRRDFEGAVFTWVQARGVGDFEKTTVEQRVALWHEIDGGTFPAR